MPRQIHRFYLYDREPDMEAVKKVMKEEVGDCEIKSVKVEDRTKYKEKMPDRPGTSVRECITVVVGYVKEACNRAILSVKELKLPFEDQNPTDQKVRDAVLKAVGNVKIINWSKVNKVQNIAGIGKGRYQVSNNSEILVRYIGGSNAESADTNAKKHRLCFRHQVPDDKSVKERMWEEIGQCNVLKWYKDEPLAQEYTGLPGLTRVIVEYQEKK